MKVSTALPRYTENDIIVDNTILTASLCSTEVAMRHVLYYTTPTAAAELECGSALHEGLARWLVTGDPVVALARFDEVYRPWAAAHVPKLDKDGKPNRLRWLPIHRIFERWLRNHPLARWSLVVDPAHVEIPVWAPLGLIDGGKLVALGPKERAKIDLLARPASRDPVVIMTALLDFIGHRRLGGTGTWSGDHKSSGSMGPWWKDRQEDASQFSGQLWAGAERGLHLAGVWINGIEIPRLPSSNRKCSTHSMPYEKCALEHPKSALFPVTRSKEELAAWERSAVALTRKFLRIRERVERVEDVVQLPKEGRFIGNCSRCTFRDFCRLGRTKQAASGFIKSKWNPLDHAFKRGGLRDEPKKKEQAA